MDITAVCPKCSIPTEHEPEINLFYKALRCLRCGYVNLGSAAPVRGSEKDTKRIFDELMEIEIGLGCGG